MLDPSRFGSAWRQVNIDRPIFLLGTQGGGLTLLSRILRRHRDVVSVTGDSRYWSGADEIQSVLGPILPASLTGIRHKAPKDAALPSPRGWVYATERLYPLYRRTRDDATAELAARLCHLLQWRIGRHAGLRPVRLVDKSQVFTVKVSFLQALLCDSSPVFVLVTRDPYASCQRAATKIFPEDRPLEERIRLAAEHWRNSMAAALTDAPHVEHFHTLRFEDFLAAPQRTVQHLCHSAGLPFEEGMMPAAGQRVPLGTMRRDRWHPIRADANDAHVRTMRHQDTQVVERVCGDTAEQLQYSRPAVGGRSPR